MLYLLRHGVTRLNIQGVAQSSTDQSLIKEGAHQVAQTAEIMVQLGAKIQEVICSPTKRAQESAAILCTRFASTTVVRVEKCLRERALGVFEGMDREKLIAERNRLGLEGQNPWQDWDGCNDVESDHSISLRVRPLLFAPNSTLSSIERDIVWVTHSGVIKSFLRFACAYRRGRDYTRIYVGCGGMVRIWQDAKTKEMTVDQIYNP